MKATRGTPRWLAAGMGLHIGVVAAEELLHALDGEVFNHIHIRAAAIIAAVSLSIFVGEDRALRLQNGRADEILEQSIRWN